MAAMDDTIQCLQRLESAQASKNHTEVVSILEEALAGTRAVNRMHSVWLVLAEAALEVVYLQPSCSFRIWNAAHPHLEGSLDIGGGRVPPPKVFFERTLLLQGPNAREKARLIIDRVSAGAPGPYGVDIPALRACFIREIASPVQLTERAHTIYRLACKARVAAQVVDWLGECEVCSESRIEFLQAFAAGAEFHDIVQDHHAEWLWGDAVVAWWRTRGLM